MQKYQFGVKNTANITAGKVTILAVCPVDSDLLSGLHSPVGNYGLEVQRRLIVTTSQRGWTIIRDSHDRIRWRKRVRDAARAAEHNSL